jgi:energy-converting hydrogenase Eha subunit B
MREGSALDGTVLAGHVQVVAEATLVCSWQGCACLLLEGIGCYCCGLFEQHIVYCFNYLLVLNKPRKNLNFILLLKHLIIY